MRWKKLGLVFRPQEHEVMGARRDYAQSPQALVLADRIRVYFSTRSVDPENGKFLSHVAYVDFDRKMEKILGVSEKQVIALGGLGCFDEHGIFPFSVFQEGKKIAAYTCGWSRRKSVSVETSTGYAVSTDQGQSFEKLGTGPIFSASLHEPFLVGDSFVRKYGDVYHMWYIYGERWVRETESAPPDRVYKIAHAISGNGIDWTRDGRAIISDRLHQNECQALPSVVKVGGRYHMYFCYRDIFGFRTDKSKAYRLGYASSDNLVDWTRDDSQSGIEPEQEWESDMICYPTVFEADGKIYLLYNGNKFGRDGFGAAVLESE